MGNGKANDQTLISKLQASSALFSSKLIARIKLVPLELRSLNFTWFVASNLTIKRLIEKARMKSIYLLV